MIAHQKLCRDKYNHIPAPSGIDLDLKKSVIKLIPRSFAEKIILQYEWLGTMATSRYHYGIFFSEHCGGVCCFAVNGSGTAGGNVHLKYGVERKAVVTLVRGACVHWSPPNANSRLVSKSIRLLSADYPDGEIVVAYSDNLAGEIGTIYQACGWYYLGMTSRSASKIGAKLISPEGKVVDKIKVAKEAEKTGLTWSEQMQAMLASGWTRARGNRKHVYGIAINRGSIADANLKAKAKPYPKRASKAFAVDATAKPG